MITIFPRRRDLTLAYTRTAVVVIISFLPRAAGPLVGYMARNLVSSRFVVASGSRKGPS